MTSQATWKVIAADMPIGLIVICDTDRKWGVEAIAPERRGRRAAASSRSASYEDVPSSVGLPGNPSAFAWANCQLCTGRPRERERRREQHCNTDAICQGCFDDGLNNRSLCTQRGRQRGIHDEATMRAFDGLSGA